MASIDDIKLTKCNQDLIRRDLDRLKQPTSGTLKQLAERLIQYYEDSGLQIADCDTCLGGSDASLTVCPFCGEAGNVFEEDSDGLDDATAAEVVGEMFEGTEPTEELEAGEDVPDEEKEEQVANKKATKKKATKAEKAPKAAKAPKGLTAKKAPAPPPVEDEDDALEGEIVDEPNPEGPGTALVTVEALDAQVSSFRDNFKGGAVAMHRMGQSLRNIMEGNLWKLRSDKKGVPLYKNFKDFCDKELNYAPTHAYRAIAAAKHFSEKEIEGLSGRQVRLLLELPAGEHRDELMTAAKRGEGVTKLSARADALRGTKPKDVPKSKQSITVSMPQGITKLPMYAAPNTGGAKVGDTENAKRAKRLAEAPWAMMELPNRTKVFFRMGKNPKTEELILAVEVRRQEPVL